MLFLWLLSISVGEKMKVENGILTIDLRKAAVDLINCQLEVLKRNGIKPDSYFQFMESKCYEYSMWDFEDYFIPVLKEVLKQEFPDMEDLD